MYAKCIPHFDKLLYTFCLKKFVEMWDTFCIQTFCVHFVYKYFVYILYTSILSYKNSYRMYMQIIVCRMNPLFQHIYESFIVHFLITASN